MSSTPYDSGTDPFYGHIKETLDAEVKKARANETPCTVAETGSDFNPRGKIVVAGTGQPNGPKLMSTEGEVLEKIHQMRLQQFEIRTKQGDIGSSGVNEKPYLPMLSSDEKELILEQYYHSKKKLGKV